VILGGAGNMIGSLVGTLLVMVLYTSSRFVPGWVNDLFGWEINSNNPMNYGVVQREGNVSADGVGIGGGVGQGPEGYDGHVTFYVEVPDVEAALAKAEGLGGARVMGPEQIMEGIELGLFTDPEGHLVGVVKSAD